MQLQSEPRNKFTQPTGAPPPDFVLEHEAAAAPTHDHSTAASPDEFRPPDDDRSGGDAPGDDPQQ